MTYNEKEYDRRYETLSSPAAAIVYFSEARLQYFKNLIENRLDPERRVKIKTSLHVFKALANKINSFIDESKGEKKVTASWLRNVFFYENDTEFRSLSEEEKLTKGIKKNNNIAKGVERFLLYYTKQISIPDWHPNTKRSNTPQESDYLILPLQGKKLKRLTCWIFSNSKYYRIGAKFIGGNTFGDKTIKSIDKNVLVHTGVGSMDDRLRNDLFTAVFLNGNRVLRSEKDSQDYFTGIIPENDSSYKFNVFIDDDDFLHLSIDDEQFETVLVDPDIQSKVYLFSWADGVEYNLIIKNITIEIKAD